jgi:hypothetical protein
MTIAIVGGVLGVVIGAACLGIPQLVRIRHTEPDNDDTQAYLKQTGRSADEIAESNASLRTQQQKAVRPQQTSGSDDAPALRGAG